MALCGRAMLALLVMLGLHSATATEYTVGGSGGWALQSSNSVYDNQFASINLVVGDTLSFPYTAPQHNVYEILPANLASCNFVNPIAKFTQSNPVITLSTAGVHAFACEVPTHCSQFGMQLSVNVSGAAAPVPAPVTAPSPAPVTTPTPAPVTRTPAPGPAKRAPAPAPKHAPATSPKGSVPAVAAPAPTPAGPGANAGSVVTSGPAMVLGAIVAGFAVLLL